MSSWLKKKINPGLINRFFSTRLESLQKRTTPAPFTMRWWSQWRNTLARPKDMKQWTLAIKFACILLYKHILTEVYMCPGSLMLKKKKKLWQEGRNLKVNDWKLGVREFRGRVMWKSSLKCLGQYLHHVWLFTKEKYIWKRFINQEYVMTDTLIVTQPSLSVFNPWTWDKGHGGRGEIVWGLNNMSLELQLGVQPAPLCSWISRVSQT